MRIESIKGFLKEPFRAFVVRTASGESHEVPRPDAISLSPRDDLIVLWPSEGGMVFVEVDQITEILPGS